LLLDGVEVTEHTVMCTRHFTGDKDR